MSEQAKHTPGPWRIDGQFDAEVSVEIFSGEILVCEIGPFLEDWHETEIANTRLMAAAPDLLDALRVAESFVADELEIRKNSFLPDATEAEDGYIGSAQRALGLIVAAIAKAMGAAE